MTLPLGTGAKVQADVFSQSAKAASGKAKLDLRIADGLLSAKVSNVSLGEILGKLAGQSGVKILSFAPVDEMVSFEFNNLPLSEALTRLLRDLNAAYFYSTRADEKSGKPIVFLSEVRIFGASGNRTQQARVFEPMRISVETAAAKASAADGRQSRDPRITALAKQLHESQDRETRKSVVEQLAKLSDADAQSILANAFSSEADPSVRATMATALGRSWDDAAVEPLARMLTRDASAQVREAAARALGQLWSDNAVPYLIDALLHERDAMVREQVALALGDSADEEAVDALAHALTHDPRWFVREAAATALAKLGGTAAQLALLTAAAYDSDAWVKETAAQSGLAGKP